MQNPAFRAFAKGAIATDAPQYGYLVCVGDDVGVITQWLLSSDFLRTKLRLQPTVPRRRPSYNPRRIAYTDTHVMKVRSPSSSPLAPIHRSTNASHMAQRETIRLQGRRAAGNETGGEGQDAASPGAPAQQARQGRTAEAQAKMLRHLPDGGFAPVCGYVDLRVAGFGQPGPGADAGDVLCGSTDDEVLPRGYTSDQRLDAVAQRPVYVHGWAAHDSQAVNSVQWTASPPGVVSSGADGFSALWSPDGALVGRLAMDAKGTVSRVGPWQWCVDVGQRHDARVREAHQVLLWAVEHRARRIIARWVRRHIAKKREQTQEQSTRRRRRRSRSTSPSRRARTDAAQPGQHVSTAVAKGAGMAGGGSAREARTPRIVRPLSIVAALDSTRQHSALGLALEAQMLTSPSAAAARRARLAVQSVVASEAGGQGASFGAVRELMNAVVDVKPREVREIRRQARRHEERRRELSGEGVPPGEAAPLRPESAWAGRKGVEGSGGKEAEGGGYTEGGGTSDLDWRVHEVHVSQLRQSKSRHRIARLRKAWKERAAEVNGAKARARFHLGQPAEESRFESLPLEMPKGGEEQGDAGDAGDADGGSLATGDAGAVPEVPPAVLYVSHRKDAHPAFRLSQKRSEEDPRIAKLGTPAFSFVPGDAAASLRRAAGLGLQDVTYGDKGMRAAPFPKETPIGGATTARRSADGAAAVPCAAPAAYHGSARPPPAGSAQAAERRARGPRVGRREVLADSTDVPAMLRVFDRSPAVDHGPNADLRDHSAGHARRPALSARPSKRPPAVRPRRQSVSSQSPRRSSLAASASMPALRGSERPHAGRTAARPLPEAAPPLALEAMVNPDRPPAVTAAEDEMPHVARELRRLRAERIERIRRGGEETGHTRRWRKTSGSLRHMSKALSAGRLVGAGMDAADAAGDAFKLRVASSPVECGLDGNRSQPAPMGSNGQGKAPQSGHRTRRRTTGPRAPKRALAGELRHVHGPSRAAAPGLRRPLDMGGVFGQPITPLKSPPPHQQGAQEPMRRAFMLRAKLHRGPTAQSTPALPTTDGQGRQIGDFRQLSLRLQHEDSRWVRK